jgi:2-keto-4-pentenoate hydratase/2-oxohepta-3-ene-1,7-dioic acid hydratase in catechol pathway
MSNESIREMWGERFGRRDPKIVCVGMNYAAHAGESGDEPPAAPLLFAKFANTLLWHEDTIVLPPGVGHVDAEAELAVVIGDHASRVPAASANGVIDAYTCANDVSARDYQFGDGQWFRGKGLDGFCPLGPALSGTSSGSGARASTASARSGRPWSTPPTSTCRISASSSVSTERCSRTTARRI